MPISTSIRPESRLVFAIAHGRVDRDDLYRYQRQTWIDSDNRDFDCVFDATGADFSELDAADLVQFSENAAKVNRDANGAKLAIIVARQYEEELARFYESSVSRILPDGRKTLICRSMKEAMDWVRFRVKT